MNEFINPNMILPHPAESRRWTKAEFEWGVMQEQRATLRVRITEDDFDWRYLRALGIQPL